MIGQKSLALDTAIGMWQLLFEEKQWSLVDHWCQFLQARHNKAISRDTWSQLLEFARPLLTLNVWEHAYYLDFECVCVCENHYSNKGTETMLAAAFLMYSFLLRFSGPEMSMKNWKFAKMMK